MLILLAPPSNRGTEIAARCKSYVFLKEKCSAFHFSWESFVYLQCNSFFSAYDRTYRVYVSSGEMER